MDIVFDSDSMEWRHKTETVRIKDRTTIISQEQYAQSQKNYGARKSSCSRRHLSIIEEYLPRKWDRHKYNSTLEDSTLIQSKKIQLHKPPQKTQKKVHVVQHKDIDYLKFNK